MLSFFFYFSTMGGFFGNLIFAIIAQMISGNSLKSLTANLYVGFLRGPQQSEHTFAGFSYFVIELHMLSVFFNVVSLLMRNRHL